MEQRRRDPGVDHLVGSDVDGLIAAKVEERLPSDESTGGARSAAQVHRIELPLSGRIENESKERATAIARPIRPVRGAYQAMPEAVRDLELDRDALLIA